MLAAGARTAIAPHLGAVLTLSGGPGFDIDAAERLLADRTSRIPRLRQRLRRVPPGCGRPVWVDDPRFRAARHIRRQTCPSPGDESALLRLAATLITDSLPPTRPLWAATFVTGLGGDTVALIIVVHHVLVDGLGGLGMLAGLVDEGAHAAASGGIRPRASLTALAAEAAAARRRALRRLPALVHDLPRSVRAAGGVHPPAAVACSLVAETGPRRQFTVARADLAAVAATAHQHGATVNDAVLAAVTGALRRLLAARGETLGTFRVTVPVADRPPSRAAEPGNDNAPLVVEIPGDGPTRTRLRRISKTVRAARTAATGPSPAALLGPLFRVLAAAGGYRAYLRHQRRFHTVVSDLRGPDRPVSFAGAPIDSIIPLSVGELGNVTLTFVALSYAGTLTVTAIADPDSVPDLSVLSDALQSELDVIAGARRDPTGPGPMAL